MPGPVIHRAPIACASCGRAASQVRAHLIIDGRYSCKACRAARARLDQFWRHASSSDDPSACWLWTGLVDQDGYGLLTRGSRHDTTGRRAHRYSYMLLVGAIPAGMMIRHRCDQPACVNPHHLEPGTNIENMRDAVDRGRVSAGERHHSSRLTATIVASIRERYATTDVTVAELARDHGVYGSAIKQLLTGAAWRSAGGPISTIRDEQPDRTVLRGERNGRSKLTVDQVRDVRGLRAAGWTISALSRRFGIARIIVSKIIDRRLWSTVD
jgi:transposase-like protein